VVALQGVELTSTNWSCGLFIFAKANIETNAQNRAKDNASCVVARACETLWQQKPEIDAQNFPVPLS
jgi:hypothetical protein